MVCKSVTVTNSAYLAGLGATTPFPASSPDAWWWLKSSSFQASNPQAHITPKTRKDMVDATTVASLPAPIQVRWNASQHSPVLSSMCMRNGFENVLALQASGLKALGISCHSSLCPNFNDFPNLLQELFGPPAWAFPPQ